MVRYKMPTYRTRHSHAAICTPLKLRRFTRNNLSKCGKLPGKGPELKCIFFCGPPPPRAEPLPQVNTNSTASSAEPREWREGPFYPEVTPWLRLLTAHFPESGGSQRYTWAGFRLVTNPTPSSASWGRGSLPCMPPPCVHTCSHNFCWESPASNPPTLQPFEWSQD